MPLADVQVNDKVVAGNGYYPDLSTAYFIEHFAIPSEYANKTDLISDKLKAAQAEVNQELDKVLLSNGEPLNAQQIMFYKLAVCSKAKANSLISRLGSTHRDNAAAQQQASVDSYEYWLHQFVNNMRLLVGLSTTATVELL
nr:head completion/stabilization protein [Pseudoalteromonas sp. S16_S37]